jgi:hypothetical protein
MFTSLLEVTEASSTNERSETFAYEAHRKGYAEEISPYRLIKSSKKSNLRTAADYSVWSSIYPFNPYPIREDSILAEIIEEHWPAEMHQTLLENILKSGDSEKVRIALKGWLDLHFVEWLTQRRVALAAILEAAFLLKVPAIENALSMVLSKPVDEALEQVAVVAAHRIRNSAPLAPDHRQKSWRGLSAWITKWESDPTKFDYVRVGLSAALIVGADDSVPWLLHHISHGDLALAWASLDGPLDWALSAAAKSIPLRQEIAHPLFAAILNRLRRELVLRSSSTQDEDERNDYVGRAIWALGALAGQEDSSTVARIIKEMFVSGHRLDGAAAVQAGSTLAKRWPRAAWETLALAFASEPEAFGKFLFLVHRVG